MTTITKIQALPTSPFEDCSTVGIVITSGVPSYFKVCGVDLDDIVSVNWYPTNRNSVVFEMRQLILIDSTQGTFMIRVLDNNLSVNDRGGVITFRLNDDTTINFPAATYGPVSVLPLWRSADQGLDTG